MHSLTSRDSFFIDLPLTPYGPTWELQVRLVNARTDRVLDRDAVLFVEHLPVFTLGRRGGFDNLRVPTTFLESRGIDVIHVERGGDITYHGPGQLVVYPIVDLREAGWRVVDFVHALEEIMIRTAADWGIRAERNSLNRGAWVGMSKIGSVGIAVRHGVSFHGLALNVNTGLGPFSWINPCGLNGVTVTSMKEILGREIPLEEAKKAARHHMEDIVGMHLVSITPKDLDDLLSAPSPSADGGAV
jgi:lipoate-protein ligase B